MIKLYDRLLKEHYSINMRNRIFLSLENWMTPLQFVELRKQLKKRKSLIENIKTWSMNQRSWYKKGKYYGEWDEKLEYLFSKTNKTVPEKFIKKRIDRYTVLFTSKKQTTTKKDKTLLVCMTGAAGRMMMPLPVFLQYIDAEITDIIYITYPRLARKVGYRKGLPGYDKTFEEMLDRLAFLPFKKYNRVVGMGTSGGALPVLILALKYKFEAVLGVGTAKPNDSRWVNATSGKINDIIHRISENTKQGTSVYLIYGADCQKDEERANQLKRLLPKTYLLKISSKTEKVGHVALTPLIFNGEFAHLLSSSIFRVRQNN